jgi:hypothetical protein
MRYLLPLALLLATLPAAAAPPGRPPAGIVRGIYADPGAAIENRLWGGYGAGYAEDTTAKHGGTTSLRCANATDADAHGALQAIRLEQEAPRPIVVSGWARLEGVSGPADYHCSVYLDLVLKDGTRWSMKIAAFDPAQAGWQYAEATYTPPSPIESARVFVFLRERQGTAWFDDIGVQEVLDAQGTRSKNLLADPGFEAAAHPDSSLRARFFGKLQEIGCNAFHLYRGVEWEQIMGTDAARAPGPLPTVDAKDPFLDFVRDAHRRGFKVWLTVGLGLPAIQSAKSKEFPFWPCVNNRCGAAYTRAVAYFTQYGVDGIGMVPDEWNYDNSAVSEWAKHSDPEVAKFYANLPSQCDCPVCRARFRERTGLEYPDVRHLWSTADPVWADYTKFRYDSTAAWIGRSVAAAKRINPKVVTDTMICVLPVCSDDRRSTGAAWDQIGVESGLDCLQTDPYIQLHNYLGDSTHYYPTETALHLASANWQGRAGVTLEACRLYEQSRDKEPVEVYGAALSCLAHGAREFFWWYFSYLTGDVKFVSPEPPSRQVAAAYRVMRELEPSVLDAHEPGDVLVAYSRASEDTWQWLADKGPAGEAKPQPRRGFLAHHNVLSWLLRRGCPFRMTFLDHPDPARLAEARVLLVPFPFSLPAAEVKTLDAQARAGKTVILMSELSPVDERGRRLATPRLASLFGRQHLDLSGDGTVAARLGKGKLIFLGGDFALRLLRETPPMRDPRGTVPLPALDPERSARLDKLLAAALGRPASLFAAQPTPDVEVALLRGARGRLLLLTNWEPAREAEVTLRSPLPGGAGRAEGYAILKDTTVAPVRESYAGDRWRIRLRPQEARLVRLVEGRRQAP